MRRNRVAYRQLEIRLDAHRENDPSASRNRREIDPSPTGSHATSKLHLQEALSHNQALHHRLRRGARHADTRRLAAAHYHHRAITRFINGYHAVFSAEHSRQKSVPYLPPWVCFLREGQKLSAAFSSRQKAYHTYPLGYVFRERAKKLSASDRGQRNRRRNSACHERQTEIAPTAVGIS